MKETCKRIFKIILRSFEILAIISLISYFIFFEKPFNIELQTKFVKAETELMEIRMKHILVLSQFQFIINKKENELLQKNLEIEYLKNIILELRLKKINKTKELK